MVAVPQLTSLRTPGISVIRIVNVFVPETVLGLLMGLVVTAARNDGNGKRDATAEEGLGRFVLSENIERPTSKRARRPRSAF